MSDRSFSGIGILGIVVGILGVIGPIGWDYYKNKSDLTIQIVERATLAENSQGVAGLEIIYNSQKISRVSRVAVSIKNSGRTPILGKDVVSPVRLVLSDGSDPLEARILDRYPPSLEATATLVKATRTVTLDFPLLNPGDVFNVGILVQNDTADISAHGRVAGISEITKLPDRSIQPPKEKLATWKVVAIGASSIFLAILSFGCGILIPQELSVRAELRRGTFTLPAIASRDATQAYLSSLLRFVTASERASLHEAVRAMSDSSNFSHDHTEAIRNEIDKTIKSSLSNVPVSIVSALIAIGGISYLAVYW